MITETLQEYGLTQREAKVYLLCLEYGMMQAAKIASLAHINRTSCYDLLEVMKGKQLLIESKKGGVKYYIASDPSLLFAGLKKKYTAFESMLPELIDLSSKFGIKPKIKLFEGLEGMKQMYNDTLSSETDIYAYCGNHVIEKQLMHFFNTEYVPDRVKKGIRARVILSESEENKHYHEESHNFLRETYIIQDAFIDVQCEINIYGSNKILIGLYNATEMAGIIIESKSLHDTLLGLFKFHRNVLQNHE